MPFLEKILNKIFRLNQHETTIKTELLGGIATYLGCAYILFVNPMILSNAGMDKEALFTATGIMVIVGCLLMALVANLPIIMAPTMGANSWFAFTVVLGLGFTWQQGLAAVALSGLLFIAFTFSRLRQVLIDNFSTNMKLAIGAGIGAFIASIGIKLSGMAIVSQATVITIGSMLSIPVMMTLLGLVMIVVLDYYRIVGGMIITIGILSGIGFFLGQSSYSGIISMPPSIASTFWQLDFSQILNASFIAIALSLFLMDFLDSTGTFVSLFPHMNASVQDKRFQKGLLLDGIATVVGPFVGTSTVGPYIESAAGIKAGARTGLAAMMVALLFGLSLFVSPLLSLVPYWATSPILLYVGALMFKNISAMNWENTWEIIPCVLTIIMMPLTSSIAHGIGLGVLTWVVISVATRHFDIRKHIMMLAIAAGYIGLLTQL